MGKKYNSVLEMVKDLDPEFAVYYEKHEKKWSVRFRRWRQVKWLRFKIWWSGDE